MYKKKYWEWRRVQGRTAEVIAGLTESAGEERLEEFCSSDMPYCQVTVYQCLLYFAALQCKGPLKSLTTQIQPESWSIPERRSSYQLCLLSGETESE